MEKQKRKQGKNARFEECYEAYYFFVIRMALRGLKKHKPAENICQRVFVSLYLNMDQVAPGFEKPWLMRETKKQINALRQNSAWYKKILPVWRNCRDIRKSAGRRWRQTCFPPARVLRYSPNTEYSRISHRDE